MLVRALILLAVGLAAACSQPPIPVEQDRVADARADSSAARTSVGAALQRHADVDALTGVALHGFGALENAYLALGDPSLTVEAAAGWAPVEQAWAAADEAMEALPARHASLAAALLAAGEQVEALDAGPYRVAELAFLDDFEQQLAAEREVTEVLLAHREAYRGALERSRAHLDERAAGAFATPAGSAAAYRSALAGFEDDVNAFNVALEDPESRRAAAAEALRDRAEEAQRAYEELHG